MKKTATSVLILAMIFMSTQILNAQEKGTSQIHIGFGAGSLVEYVDDVGSFLGAIFPTIGNISTKNSRYSGVLNIGYRYAVINKLMLGVNVAYQNGKKDQVVSDQFRPVFGNLEGTINSDFFTFGIDGHYHYISNPSFQMYSGLGLGYTIQNDNFKSNTDSSSNSMNSSNLIYYQVTAIGLRFGKTIAAYTELGFGYKGVLSAGINYQF